MNGAHLCIYSLTVEASILQLEVGTLMQNEAAAAFVDAGLVSNALQRP